MTPAAAWYFGPENGREHSLHLLLSVAPIDLESEQTAVLAAEVASQAFLLSPVMVPGRAVTYYEFQDVGPERYDVIRIKVLSTRRFWLEVYC